MVRWLKRIKPHDRPQGVVWVARKILKDPLMQKWTDNMTHPIEHIEWNSIFIKRNWSTWRTYVRHVPNIAKNVVIFDQMVEHGMKVKFNESGCFIEWKGKLMARGRREGQMFVLDFDVQRMLSVTFAHNLFANMHRLVAQTDWPHRHGNVDQNIARGRGERIVKVQES